MVISNANRSSNKFQSHNLPISSYGIHPQLSIAQTWYLYQYHRTILWVSFIDHRFTIWQVCQRLPCQKWCKNSFLALNFVWSSWAAIWSLLKLIPNEDFCQVSRLSGEATQVRSNIKSTLAQSVPSYTMHFCKIKMETISYFLYQMDNWQTSLHTHHIDTRAFTRGLENETILFKCPAAIEILFKYQTDTFETPPYTWICHYNV